MCIVLIVIHCHVASIAAANDRNSQSAALALVVFVQAGPGQGFVEASQKIDRRVVADNCV